MWKRGKSNCRWIYWECYWKCLLIDMADERSGMALPLLPFSWRGDVCEMGAEFILYSQQSAVNFGAQKVSGTLVQFLGCQRKPFWSHFTITYHSLESYAICIFPWFPCVWVSATISDTSRDFRDGGKKPQTIEFTYFKVMLNILGSKLREQSRI